MLFAIESRLADCFCCAIPAIGRRANRSDTNKYLFIEFHLLIKIGKWGSGQFSLPHFRLLTFIELHGRCICLVSSRYTQKAVSEYSLNPSFPIFHTPLNMPFKTASFINQDKLIHILSWI